MVQRNFTIYQGATFEIVLEHLNADGTPVAAVDVTQVRCQGRKSLDSNGTLFSLTVGSGVTKADGELVITLTPAQTSMLDFVDGVYDVLVDYADGKTERVLMGKLYLSKGVTS